jgi:hypothetical protein
LAAGGKGALKSRAEQVNGWMGPGSSDPSHAGEATMRSGRRRLQLPKRIDL